jgi:Ser/Thr protein kinase RdoA (MazF antagonist)
MFTEQVLAAWLPLNFSSFHAAAAEDGQTTITAQLLRSYTNDVYLVRYAGMRSILKVYGLRWRSAGEVAYEVDLIRHLARGGLGVAKPIAGSDGETVRQIAATHGLRMAVLFEYAPGEKPQPPFNEGLYFQFGEAIAKMHQLSDDFSTHHPRKNIDLETLVERPLWVILPLLEDRAAAAYLQSLGKRIKDRITRLSPDGLDWGPIHGDATLDNLHVTADGQIVLYDFDSGGPGWRASDLQGWAIGYPEYQARYQSYMEGYRNVRPVREADIEASWFLTLAWDLWGMQTDLENRVLAQGLGAVDAYLEEQVARLRERARFLPGSD